jgi:hypothetical protein
MYTSNSPEYIFLTLRTGKKYAHKITIEEKKSRIVYFGWINDRFIESCD